MRIIMVMVFALALAPGFASAQLVTFNPASLGLSLGNSGDISVVLSGFPSDVQGLQLFMHFDTTQYTFNSADSTGMMCTATQIFSSNNFTTANADGWVMYTIASNADCGSAGTALSMNFTRINAVGNSSWLEFIFNAGGNDGMDSAVFSSTAVQYCGEANPSCFVGGLLPVALMSFDAE